MRGLACGMACAIVGGAVWGILSYAGLPNWAGALAMAVCLLAGLVIVGTWDYDEKNRK